MTRGRSWRSKVLTEPLKLFKDEPKTKVKSYKCFLLSDKDFSNKVFCNYLKKTKSSLCPYLESNRLLNFVENWGIKHSRGKENLSKGTTFNPSTWEGNGQVQVDLEPVFIFFKETNTTEYTQQNKVCTEYNKIYIVLYS